jgi:hypothetical protein
MSRHVWAVVLILARLKRLASDLYFEKFVPLISLIQGMKMNR